MMAISMVGVERQEELLDTDDTVVETSQYLRVLEATKHTSGPAPSSWSYLDVLREAQLGILVEE